MRKIEKYSGQSMVEFALLIPLVLALLLGFFDLGRALFYASSLNNAVREGTRSGIVTPYDEQAIKDQVHDFAFGLPNKSTHLTIDVIPTKDNKGIFYLTLQIDATFCFVPVTPGITDIIGNNCTDGENENIKVKGIELTATSKMQYEPGFK